MPNSASSSPLLVRFDSEEPSAFNCPRRILKECAKRLNVSETRAVHLAINRLYMSLFSEEKDFDYPEGVSPVADPKAMNQLIGWLDKQGEAIKAADARAATAATPKGRKRAT